MRERHIRRIKRIQEFRFKKGGFEDSNAAEWGIRELLTESVHDIAMLHHLSGRIAEARKAGKPELAENLMNWRDGARTRLAQHRKAIENLSQEKIKSFVGEAEKAGMSREELLELSPPFLRKRILELK
jgi:hypothetical protein